MAFQQILAVANRNNASGASPAVAMPAGLHNAEFRVDLATPNTFTDPVAQELDLSLEWSFDGGTTFQNAATAFFNGSATGTWGKGSTNPLLSVQVPQGPPDAPSYPTHVRGSYVQTGHYSFGISVETT